MARRRFIVPTSHLGERIEDFSSLAADDADLNVEEHNKCSHSLGEEFNVYELLNGRDVNPEGVEESRFFDSIPLV